MNEAIEFANWLNNNWYHPYGTGKTWRVSRSETDYTTEELYKKWKSQK